MRTSIIVLTLLFLLPGLLHAEDAKKLTADKERVIKTVRFLSEENFPRSANPNNKEKTIDYITKSLAATGLEVTHDEFAVKTIICDPDFPASGNNEESIVLEVRRTPVPPINIHALKKGKGNKRIVIGAHFDIVERSPGADDNASGVAVLIELAHMLKETPELNCDVEFVSYDMEENGLFGSRYHAKKLKKQKVDVVCMLCMDVVGYFSDEENSQDYPLPGLSSLYGTKGDGLAMIGRPEDFKLIAETQKAFRAATTLKIVSLPAPKGLDILLSRSDHAPFWWEGYPALFFTDTADFRNKNYHKATDTWDTLDYDLLAEVPVGVYHVMLAIDAMHAPK
jgi:Zn-dependent M28 family amino/carboxypeptidase